LEEARVSGVQERRSKVTQADDIADNTRLGLDVPPGDRQRYPCAHVVQRRFASWAWHAIVAGSDQNCVFQLLDRFKVADSLPVLAVRIAVLLPNNQRGHFARSSCPAGKLEH